MNHETYTDTGIILPKVSVIVPVYNCADYLRDTLNSIAGQTYRNLEVLLVDDGSTDGSGRICDEYARSNAIFRVFHTVNGGVAKARNYALNRMTGSYVVFIDADDLVKPEYIEKLVQTAQASGMKMVLCRNVDGHWTSPSAFREHRCAQDPPVVHVSLHTNYYPTSTLSHPVVWGGL